MTFEEWWKEKNNNLEMFIRGIFPNKYMDNARLVAKRFSEMAWESAQPKWTYCKDGMPTEDGNYLVAVLLTYGHRIVLTSDYDANNCDFWEIDPDREIIAWMSLPEAPNVHDD